MRNYLWSCSFPHTFLTINSFTQSLIITKKNLTSAFHNKIQTEDLHLQMKQVMFNTSLYFHHFILFIFILAKGLCGSQGCVRFKLWPPFGHLSVVNEILWSTFISLFDKRFLPVWLLYTLSFQGLCLLFSCKKTFDINS